MLARGSCGVRGFDALDAGCWVSLLWSVLHLIEVILAVSASCGSALAKEAACSSIAELLVVNPSGRAVSPAVAGPARDGADSGTRFPAIAIDS